MTTKTIVSATGRGPLAAVELHDLERRLARRRRREREVTEMVRAIMRGQHPVMVQLDPPLGNDVLVGEIPEGSMVFHADGACSFVMPDA